MYTSENRAVRTEPPSRDERTEDPPPAPGAVRVARAARP
jgi:hypothetical protein